MSVRIPPNMGIIQRIIKMAILPIDSLSRTFKQAREDVKNEVTRQTLRAKSQFDQMVTHFSDQRKELKKQFKFDFKIPGSIEDPKYEPVITYISGRPDAQPLANLRFEYKMALDCESMMLKVQLELDKISKMLMEKVAPLDKLLSEKLKPIVDIVNMIMDMIKKLESPGANLGELASFCGNVLKLLQDIVALLILPYVEKVDMLYEFYRGFKVDATLAVLELSSMLEINCVVNCEYVNDPLKCPIIQKLKLTNCPLLEVIGSSSKKLSDKVNRINNKSNIKNVADMIEGIIDNCTKPCDQIFSIFETVANTFPVNKVISRHYPPVTVPIVKGALDSLGEDLGGPPTIAPQDVNAELY